MKTFTVESHKWFLIMMTLIAGLGLALPVLADQGYEMHHGGMHGAKGMYGGSGMCGPSWKETLTDEQRSKLAKLKLDHMKVKAPLKAKIKSLKVDLAMLVIADKPDVNAINKKIDELTKLKNEKMKQKYEYIAAKRKVLTPDQQVLFDMHIIKKAMHGKTKGGCRH